MIEYRDNRKCNLNDNRNKMIRRLERLNEQYYVN